MKDESPNSNTSSIDHLFQSLVEEVIKDCDKLFTSEESNGKYLDLNLHYKLFLGIKEITETPKDYLNWL